MKHLLLLLLSCFFGWIEVGAETTEKLIIHCEATGCLSDSLKQNGYTDFSQISNLTVTGKLNAADFRLIKQMQLESLDLSDVTIEAFYGIGTYEPGMLGQGGARQYPAHTLPVNAFSFISSSNNGLSGMKQLKSIILPKNLKAIGSQALAFSSITQIIFPETLEEIGTDAFYGCEKLETIDLPASVNYIGSKGEDAAWYGAFARCNSLKQIKVSEDNRAFKSINDVLYCKDGTIIRQYPIGRTDSVYQIADGVKRIGHEAFENCQSLQTIILPASVEVIERAFWLCDNLTTVVCKGEIPADWYAIGSKNLVEPFDSKLMLEGWLIVPAGTKGIYEKDIYMSWGEFKQIREAEEATSISLPVNTGYQLTTGYKQIHLHSDQSLSVTISTISGQIIFQGIKQGGSHTFPLLYPGLYIVQLNRNSHKIYCK